MGSTRRLPYTGIVLTSGLLLLGGVGFGLWAVDRLASRLVDRFAPVLERTLSGPLGHPVRFGAYAGLRPWGIALGESGILPSATDRSEISIESIVAQVDPVASLRNWQPVIKLRFKGAQASLRRSQDGRYWIPGKQIIQGNLPRITLLYDFDRPAQISFAPIDQTLRLSSRGSVVLGDRWFSGRANLQSLNGAGSVDLEARGRWDQPELLVRMRPDRVDLENLAMFTSAPADARVSGHINGDVRLRLKPGYIDCLGGVQLKALQFDTSSMPGPLRSDLLKLSCRDQRLELADSRLRLQDWSARASGSFTLNRSVDLAVGLRHAVRKDRINLRIDGPWALPRWRFTAGLELPADGPLQGPVQLVGQMTTPWTTPGSPQVRVDDLRVASRDLSMRLDGDLFPALSLRSRELTLRPEGWRMIPALSTALGSDASIQGRLAADGTLQDPSLQGFCHPTRRTE